MEKETFEKFLEGIFLDIFPATLDDDIPSDFDDWLGEMDVEQCMKWAELYGKEQFLAGQDHTLNTIYVK